MEKQNFIQKTIEFINKLKNKIMKKNDQNMGQVEARSTDRLGSLGTALGVLALALLLSSYTLYKKAEVNLAQTCYEYEGVDKTSPNAADETMDPSKYASSTSSIICPKDETTLCGFCFEAGDFELDANNKPLLRYPVTNSPTPLGEVVLANWTNELMHNIPITASNGKQVTLLFRAEK